MFPIGARLSRQLHRIGPTIKDYRPTIREVIGICTVETDLRVKIERKREPIDSINE
jgi:hypothetical protein